MTYLDVEEHEQRKFRPHTLGRLMGMILKHRKPLLLGISMVITGTLAALLEPRILGFAIDEAIISKRWNYLKWLAASFLIVTGLRTGAAIQQGYFFELLGQCVTQD